MRNGFLDELQYTLIIKDWMEKVWMVIRITWLLEMCLLTMYTEETKNMNLEHSMYMGAAKAGDMQNLQSTIFQPIILYANK